MRVGFVGFGLIGGSIARALRQSNSSELWSLIAWSPSGAGPAQAAADGVIDHAAITPEQAIEGADFVLLAGPPTTCLDALDSLAGRWRRALSSEAVVTDVASTKAAIVDRANTLELRFVGGHPMAGLELNGYGASTPDLFLDRPWVTVPGSHAESGDADRVESLALATGAIPLRLEAAAHDRAVAGISHLPLILAAALVEAVAGRTDVTRQDWPTAARLAAGGWRDMTRLAQGDAAMGAGIAVTNAPAIRERLADLEGVLASWREQLEGDTDEDDLRERFEAVRRRLRD